MKILYVHGFLSSGASGTAKLLRQALPSDTILSPDLPIHPAEALDFLHDLVAQEHPDLIIGSSMGGMLTEMLYGTPRILVNPAFQMGDTLAHTLGLGRYEFLSPRQDGVKDLLVNKSYVKEFEDITSLCFAHANDEGEQDRVFGLFGRQDPTVHSRPIFQQHYRHDFPFQGEHRLNEHIVKHTLLPVIAKVQDAINGTQRPILYIAIDGCIYRDPALQLVSNAHIAFERLATTYNTFLVTDNLTDNAAIFIEKLEMDLGVLAHNRVIFTHAPELLYGDYFLLPQTKLNDRDKSLFLASPLAFGSPDLKTWDDTLTFFSRLGGQ